MNGWITIGTKMDSKQLQKDIEKAKKQLEKYDKEAERLATVEAKLNIDNQKARAKLGEIDNDLATIERKLQAIREVETPTTLKGREDYKQLLQQRDELNQKAEIEANMLEDIIAKQNNIKKKKEENTQEQERLNDRIKTNIDLLEQAKKQEGMQDVFNNAKTGVDDVNKGLKGVLNKVAKWGLALVGVRSMYSGIRSAMNLVLGNNEELSNKMQQMRNVLAEALTPLVQTIVNALAKAMVYINYIFNALTGKNLFDFSKATSNASNSLKKGAKNSGAIADNLKEARKQLAGFDEMNVLSDNVASSGGGVGGIGDEFENIFDKLKGIKIPKWVQTLTDILKKLKKYWKELIIVVGAFGTALLALKITSFIKNMLGIQGMSTKVQGGLALITAGLTMLIGSVINLTLNWDKMTAKEKAINLALAGIGSAFVALGTSIMMGVSVATFGIGLLISAIVAMVTSLATQIAKEEEAIAKIYDEKVQQDELTEAKKRAKEAYDELIDAVDRQSQANEDLIEVQGRTGLSGEELWKSVENGTLKYQDMTKEQRETYKAYKNLIQANEDLKNANDEKVASDSRVIKKEYDVRIANSQTKYTYQELKKEIVEAWKKGELTAEDASDSISRMMGDMSADSYDTFVKDIPDDIKSGLDPGKYRSTWDKFRDNWNYWINSLARKIGLDFNANYHYSGAGHGFAKGGIVVPKLANGGIINQPGRGVPIASAIGGESGREGVIPLTDSQQMAMLGEAIGKYITINASITNTMNGRVISRELQRIQQENSFASNR